MHPLKIAALLGSIVLAGDCTASASADELRPPQDQPRGPSAAIQSLVNRGRLLRNQGDRPAALAVFEEALQKARAAADKPGEAWAMNNIASIYRYEATDNRALEHSQRATALYEQARAFALLHGDDHNAAYATLYLGVLAEQRQETETAIALFESALPLFKTANDPYYVARTCTCLGQAMLHRRRDPRRALGYFEQALSSYRQAEVWSEAALVLRDMRTAYEQLARP